jgi:WD40 repeat protein
VNHLLINTLIIIQIGVSCKWTNDSQRFLLEHLDTIRESPSQIYHSALPFSPSTTWLQECYGSKLSQEVKVVKGLPAGWGICSRTVSFGTTIYGISCFHNTVAVGSGHQDISILDAITGSCKTTLSGHTDEVWSVTFSLDGRSLVSGSADKTVKLWDMQTGGTIKTFSGHTELVSSVSISVDYTTIASGSFDTTVRIWDTQTGECHHVIKHQYEVYCSKISPIDPQYILSMSNHDVHQWNISGHQVGSTFEGTDVDFSPDGTQIVSRYMSVATIRNSSLRAVVATFPVVLDNGRRCCFSPDGRLVAVSAGTIAHVWDITSSEPHHIEAFMGHSDDIQYFAWSSPSSLISGSIDQSVKFWLLGTQPTDLVRTDPKPTSLMPVTIMSITLRAKDGIYITSDSYGVVRVCDIFTGLCKSSFQTPAKGASKRDIGLIHGRLILAWHTDGEIKVWDIEKEELLLTADGPEYLEDIKISEDGSRVFSKGARVIQAQSMQTGEIVGKRRIRFLPYDIGSLATNDLRVWVYFSAAPTQVWDFGTPDSPPVQLPNIPLQSLHPSGVMLWDTGLSCVKEKATGNIVFQLSKKYGRPINVQWSNQYLVASFISGEVLVLDFSYMLPL